MKLSGRKSLRKAILSSEPEHTLRQGLFALLVYYIIAVNAIFDGVNGTKKKKNSRKSNRIFLLKIQKKHAGAGPAVNTVNNYS